MSSIVQVQKTELLVLKFCFAVHELSESEDEEARSSSHGGIDVLGQMVTVEELERASTESESLQQVAVVIRNGKAPDGPLRSMSLWGKNQVWSASSDSRIITREREFRCTHEKISLRILSDLMARTGREFEMHLVFNFAMI
jgi:hypothetical protein